MLKLSDYERCEILKCKYTLLAFPKHIFKKKLCTKIDFLDFITIYMKTIVFLFSF